jgi:YidC/Oxa1 family membrane protein insertase
MDKKNTLIGLALLAAAFGMMYFQAPQPTENANQPAPTTTQPVSQAPAYPNATAPIIAQPNSTGGSGPAILETIGSHVDEQVVALENELMEARFTNYGGAIQEITLKEFDKSRDDDSPYVMNGNRVAPALELTGLPGLNKDTTYQLVEPSGTDTVEYRAVVGDNLQVTRRYIIEQDTTNEKPYLIRHELEFRNLSNDTLPIGDFSLNAGTVAPSGPQDAQLLTFGYFDGEDTEFLAQGKFTGSSIPFFSSAPRDSISENRNIDWVSLKNQFFITILKPDEKAVGYFAQPVPFPQGDEDRPQIGVSGSMKMDSFTLAPMDSQTFGFNYYIGPKIFDRISRVGESTGESMQFGFFSLISKTLLTMMNKFYAFTHNYGIAIILVTLAIKILFLPINLMSSRSMKRMSKLQEPMKAVNEKFGDNPSKKSQLMMELYKVNKVNPVAGCLPMVIQIPIFFGLFYMLRSAAELRLAEFMWISDLSMQEGIFTLPFTIPFMGDQFNILPFFYLASMVVQMGMMPTPSVDNAQVKMMKYMPYVFFPIIYTFASGLVLYWTINNLFTIAQQWMINRKKHDFEIILPPALKKAMEAPKKKKRKK